ncbi:hypothetical protein DXG01_002240, partial [Tephrocybe rancida]
WLDKSAQVPGDASPSPSSTTRLPHPSPGPANLPLLFRRLPALHWQHNHVLHPDLHQPNADGILHRRRTSHELQTAQYHANRGCDTSYNCL